MTQQDAESLESPRDPAPDVTASPDKPTIRVAGLLVHEGRILMVEQGREGERYWLLPGGGVHFGETLSDALRREYIEELGVRVGVSKLLAIVESVSPDPSYLKHVVHLVFEVSAPYEVVPEPQRPQGALRGVPRRTAAPAYRREAPDHRVPQRLRARAPLISAVPRAPLVAVPAGRRGHRTTRLPSFRVHSGAIRVATDPSVLHWILTEPSYGGPFTREITHDNHRYVK